MNLLFSNKRISGILCVMPQNEISFDDEVSHYNFPPEKTMKLKQLMGFNKHRIVEEGTCVSDLCTFGLQYMFDNEMLDRNEIDALILVSQSFDHYMPPTSNIIQGRLKLKQDMVCMDINQGCSGFLVGLMQAFMLLEQESINKVVLLNADVLSRKVSKKDRNSYPLAGDGASITILERDCGQKKIFANIKMDGGRGNCLMIPAGGFRMPATSETAELEDAGDGNLRSKEHLVMDGAAVFQFVQIEVPPMIESLLAYSGTELKDIDYFMFHQPNKFMLQKLASRLGIPYEKIPFNIVENFGNSSGVTVPINIAYNIGEQLTGRSCKLCLAGFGAGLTWSSMIMDVGYLNFCRMIEYKYNVL